MKVTAILSIAVTHRTTDGAVRRNATLLSPVNEAALGQRKVGGGGKVPEENQLETLKYTGGYKICQASRAQF